MKTKKGFVQKLEFSAKEPLHTLLLRRRRRRRRRDLLLGCCLWSSGFDHHGGLLERVIPASPAEPNDALPGGQILGIVQVQTVQASTA